MTVSTTTNRTQLNGNGSTSAFPFSFKYTAKAEIVVIVTSSAGVDSTKTLGTHYTLTDPADNGGTVTFLSSPTDHRPQSGEVVTITRTQAVTQTFDPTAGGGLSSSTVEATFDKSVMLIQQTLEQVGRAPKLTATTTSTTPTFPEPVASKLIAWNSAGDDLENVAATDIDVTTVTPFIETLVDDASAAEARETLGVEIGVDVQAYSANLDGWAAEDPSDYSTTAEADVLYLTPAEGNAAYQPLDADLTTLGAGGSEARDFLGLGTGDSPEFTAVNLGTATEVYALSDEGNYTAISHIVSDDYNRLIRISRVSSSDGNHVPMDIALASRGTKNTPLPVEVGDRSWAIAAAGRAANGTWQRLGYQWYEVKSAPSGDIIPGMWVLRVTKPDDYFPRTILSADWTDGLRRSAHGGFAGIIDQTDAATIAWDVTQAQVAEVTLGGNRTLLPSGMVDGFEYDFYVTADASPRIMSFSNAGGLEWYLRGSDGIFYDQNSPLALPASGFAHIKLNAGGNGLVLSGFINLITGHPQRAVAPSVQFTCLTTNRAGSNNTSAQAVFASTEDVLTVAASTAYFFEAVYSFTRSTGTTAHRTNVLFGGTATFTSIGYHIFASSTESDLGGPIPYTLGRHANVATATDLFGVDSDEAAETVTVKLSGIMRINAAGTIIPQIQYGTAPGGAPTFLAGSYFRAWPVGDNNVAAVGDWG